MQKPKKPKLLIVIYSAIINTRLQNLNENNKLSDFIT
jgi:hypothetical protein